MNPITRRQFSARLAALGAASLAAGRALAQDAPILTRPIPASGERLPAVGLGTSRVFNGGDDAEKRAELAQVLRNLVAGGGTIIDTATAYGSTEGVVGDLVAQAGLRARVFIATKLRSPDEAELRGSLERLRTKQVDLLFLHNVRDPAQDMARFRDWKAAGACRYYGVTSTYEGHYGAVEGVLKRERPDCIEIDYSVDNREVEARVLPLAAEMGAAVLIALPFGRARLFRAVRGKTLPEWAREFDAASWAQFFLKFVLAHPAVTAAIPGTSNPKHMIDNVGAMRGRLPDAAERKRMVQLVESL
jgi:aryl-alcohol dehydrogenase-like predicted oxidoreductase